MERHMSKAEQLEQFIDRLGLRHFAGKEFTPYWSRVRNGVKNSIPHESLWPNIIRTIVVLDEIRERCGSPIRLTSTYRSPAYNAAVGGEPNSYHMRFMAIDFQSDKTTPARLRRIADDLRGHPFDLPANDDFCFNGGIGLYETFVHIDTRDFNRDW